MNPRFWMHAGNGLLVAGLTLLVAGLIAWPRGLAPDPSSCRMVGADCQVEMAARQDLVDALEGIAAGFITAAVAAIAAGAVVWTFLVARGEQPAWRRSLSRGD